MSAAFSLSLAVTLSRLLSSSLILAALNASQVDRLIDCLVDRTFNSENRKKFTRFGAKKSASLGNLAPLDFLSFDLGLGRGYNSIRPNRGEVRLSQWLAQPRAGKPINFPALLSMLLQNATPLVTKIAGRR
jgi:hypothetical protein